VDWPKQGYLRWTDSSKRGKKNPLLYWFDKVNLDGKVFSITHLPCTCRLVAQDQADVTGLICLYRDSGWTSPLWSTVHRFWIGRGIDRFPDFILRKGAFLATSNRPGHRSSFRIQWIAATFMYEKGSGFGKGISGNRTHIDTTKISSLRRDRSWIASGRIRFFTRNRIMFS